MQVVETYIKGLYTIDLTSHVDSRGEFVKTIHANTFEKFQLDFRFKESYFSISNKNVIRGMHFQIPPDDQNKFVTLIKGRIIDVVVDLRKESKSFGDYFAIELSEKNRQGIYIGKGMAHGFISLENDSILEYHTTTVYSEKNDKGIHYRSFGFNWGVDTPIISERDMNFPSFKSFNSPF